MGRGFSHSGIARAQGPGNTLSGGCKVDGIERTQSHVRVARSHDRVGLIENRARDPNEVQTMMADVVFQLFPRGLAVSGGDAPFSLLAQKGREALGQSQFR